VCTGETAAYPMPGTPAPRPLSGQQSAASAGPSASTARPNDAHPRILTITSLITGMQQHLLAASLHYTPRVSTRFSLAAPDRGSPHRPRPTMPLHDHVDAWGRLADLTGRPRTPGRMWIKAGCGVTEQWKYQQPCSRSASRGQDRSGRRRLITAADPVRVLGPGNLLPHGLGEACAVCRGVGPVSPTRAGAGGGRRRASRSGA
jgi:hypothetical protein